ncbi:MAG: PepSY domain-containing protein [Flavobacteriia bacterium]|nr:PepSY domain-containing protein [Flavobacteriia bacterium]
MIKNVFRKLHLFIGLLSGFVLFIVATSGCIIAFEEEITEFIYHDSIFIKKSSNVKKPLDKLIKNATNKIDIKSFKIFKESDKSIEVLTNQRDVYYLNPYSGYLTKAYNKETDFFGTVEKIHRNLYLNETGSQITGISALCCLLMLISGIIIWWPKNKHLIKSKLTIMRKVNWRKTNYDLHNVLGFYASIVILFTVLSGLIWSYEWAENILYWATNSKQEKRIEFESDNENQIQTNQIYFSIYQQANKRFPKNNECIIIMPETKKDAIRVSLRYPNTNFFRKQDNISFNQFSGNRLGENKFDDLSLGDKFRMSNINYHTGKIFGFIGQIIIFLASLIIASLPITGFLIWRNKRKT